MKRTNWILITVMSASLMMAGCGQKGGVDTSKLENSFKSAEPAQQTSVTKVVEAVKAGNYSAALTDLQRLASNAKLTPEQQQAIKDLMAQVQGKVTEAAGKLAGDAQKATEDLKKSLPLGK